MMHIHESLPDRSQDNTAKNIEQLADTGISGDLPDRETVDYSDYIEDLKNAPTPHLDSLVHSDLSKDRTHLIDRDVDHTNAYKEYRSMIRRQYLEARYRGVNPLAYPIAKVTGFLKQFNKKEFSEFMNNKNGIRNEALQTSANEALFHHGLRLPLEYLKSGAIENILPSFTRALEASPYRRAEVYRSLGHHCVQLATMKEAVQEGRSLEEFKLLGYFSWPNEGSSLRDSKIYNIDNDTKEMRFFSSSYVDGASTPYPQKVDYEALKNALLNSPLSFKEIAAESFLMAVREIEDVPHFSGETSVKKEQALLACESYWLSGLHEEALLVHEYYTSLFEGSSPSSRPNMKTLARIQKDAGMLKEAVESYSLAMQSNPNALDKDQSFYEFIDLCGLYADSSDDVSQAALAIEHIQKWKEPIMKIWDMDHRGFYNRMIVCIHLAPLYLALGDTERAETYLSQALKDVRYFVEVHKENQTYLKEFEEREAEIHLLLESIQ